jgi:putative FmdB family regulatory protein
VPTYQYACTECDHSFEQFQSFSDDALTVCPECQGRLRKVYNAVGVVFKGSGFYRTDSRGDATNGSAGSKPDSSGSKPDSSGSTSDASGSTSGETSGTSTSTPAATKSSSTATASSSAA